MARLRVCPYCGQSITSDELVRRIRDAETAHIDELTASLHTEWETKEKENEELVTSLKTQLLDIREEQKRTLEEERKKVWQEAVEQARKEKDEDQLRLQKQLETTKKQLKEMDSEREAKIAEIQEEAAREARKEADEYFRDKIRAKQDEVEKEKGEGRKERLRLEKQVDDLMRRLQKKTADELGRIPEEDLRNLLQSEFPHDRIVHQGKGKRGGDIIHTILESGEEVGKIIYEVKNTLNWSNAFLTQAKKHRMAYESPYVILVTRAFPSGERDFAERDGVWIVSGDKAPILARVFREAIVELARQHAAGEEVRTKAGELYDYLRGPEFRERIRAIFASVERLRRLQEKERRAHDSNWKKQSREHETLHTHTSDVESKIASIVEGRLIHIPVPQ